MSVRPSVRNEQLGSHSTDFHNTLYLSVFRKGAENIKVSLKSDKNNGYFTWRPIYIFDHSCFVPLTVRNVSGKRCRRNQNTPFTSSNSHPPSPHRALYEIKWKNIVDPGRPQTKIWCLGIACWIPKAINKKLEE